MSEDPFAEQKAGVTDTSPNQFSVDLSDVPDQEFRVEPGEYPARLRDLTQDTSRAGNPMWVFEFELLGDKNRGFRLWDRATLTQKALWKVKQNLQALGYTGEQVNFDRDDAIGRKVILEVGDSEQEGYTDRSEVKRVKRHPDGPGTGGDVSDFNPEELE